MFKILLTYSLFLLYPTDKSTIAIINAIINTIADLFNIRPIRDDSFLFSVSHIPSYI